MRYTSAVPAGWLSWLGTSKRLKTTRYSVAALALRGMIRTQVHGGAVLFHAGDVEQLARERVARDRATSPAA